MLRYGWSRNKLRYICLFFFVGILLDIYGVFIHIFERDYYTDFQYPLEGDITHYIEQLKSGQTPGVPPINSYMFSHIYSCESKCVNSGGEYENVFLLYVIKSALEHFENRDMIRKTWGSEKQLSFVSIRRVFLLGENPGQPQLQKNVEEEQASYGDIVQARFIDSYFNNTLKTMSGFRWVLDYCPGARFIMFCDDDMYVSTVNVLHYIKNATNYSEFLEERAQEQNAVMYRPLTASSDDALLQDKPAVRDTDATHLSKRKTGESYQGRVNPVYDNIVSPTPKLFANSQGRSFKMRKLHRRFGSDLPDQIRLYVGRLYFVPPIRLKFDKWFISLDEYPYSMFPPFIPAGAYILSAEALEDLYYASFYTKHFRFDDVYLGLLAKKARIELQHSEEVYNQGKDYDFHGYRHVIAAHGYEKPEELMRVWTEQNCAGYA